VILVTELTNWGRSVLNVNLVTPGIGAWATKRGHHADLQRLRAGRETGKHCHGTHYEDCAAYNLFPHGQFLLRF
jgi:hypothetical protein